MLISYIANAIANARQKEEGRERERYRELSCAVLSSVLYARALHHIIVVLNVMLLAGEILIFPPVIRFDYDYTTVLGIVS